MAEQDTRAFLEDVLLRYDPNIDLSDGSAAQVELISPILGRIGPDPFSGDVATFIRERLRITFPDMALTEADETEDLIVRPMQVLIEPIIQEIKLAQFRSRLDNYPQLSDVEVDVQMGNFFESRQRGGLASGSVRIYFNAPQTISISVVHVATTSTGLQYLPARPQQITAQQMALNIEGAEYYFDVDYVAQRRGVEFNVNENSIRSVANMPGAVRVRNLRKFRGGVARETSTEFVSRVEQGRHDGSLSTEPGALSRLQRSFPEIQKMSVIGFGDVEMNRDVLRGGAFSGLLPDDSNGPVYGTAGPSDDLDGDDTTTRVIAPTGYFISRIGGDGDEPVNWYLQFSYTDGGTHVSRNARIRRIISADIVDLDLDAADEIPVSLGPTDITWMLQTKSLTLSGVPGGILSPTTPEGEIVIRHDEVHVGGHADYYVAGPIEETYAQIEGLADLSPVLTGIDGVTVEDTSSFYMGVDADMSKVRPGMALTIKEGSDSGTYIIVTVFPPQNLVWVDIALTTSAGNLSWSISEDNEVNLMDPQEPRVEGSDLRAVANSPVVTTASSYNFEDSGVQSGDILEMRGVNVTEHSITNVSSLLLTIDPPAPSTYSSVGYRVFRRSDGIAAPVVRIRSMELLDSDNAPVGAEIPPRDPVLVLSRKFHNEGSGTIFDGEVLVGLISNWGSVPDVRAKSITWEAWDAAEGVWSSYAGGSISFPVSGAPTDAQDIADTFNSNYLFALTMGTNAAAVNGDGQLTLSSTSKLIVLTGGTALDDLSFGSPGQIVSNAQIRLDLGQFYARKDVRIGDLVQVIGTRNNDIRARIASDTTPDAPDVVQTTLGPLPKGLADTLPIYSLQKGPCPTFIPERSRVVIGRPSVGSARAYFEKPTTIDFRYRNTVFSTEANAGVLEYRPDPGNTYSILPPYPETEMMSDAWYVALSAGGTHTLDNTDLSSNYKSKGVTEGDIVRLHFRDITSSEAITDLDPMQGLKLALLIGKGATSPFDVVFPSPGSLDIDTVVDTINDTVGKPVARHIVAADKIALNLDEDLAIGDTTSAAVLAALHITVGENNTHPYAGDYVIKDVSGPKLTFIGPALAPTSDVAQGKNARYQVLRNTQRVSSTQMSTQQDASGLYYADVELISTAPGDAYNLGSDNILDASGYVSEGYRLRPLESTHTYSTEEVLHADISTTILLPGSSDFIQDTLRLYGQNVQVNYDRSQLVEDVQGYVTSRYNRHVGMNPLARHLLPHYVNLHWHYVGGASESDILRYLRVAIDDAAADAEFEVNNLVAKMKELRATSVFVKDLTKTTGRSAPSALIVYYDQERVGHARIVTDFLRTSRLQRFIDGNVRVTRSAAAL